jgi:2'-5' RNA ligase
MSTPLSDPDNVMMVLVEDAGGFTDDDVQRILNGQPLVASAGVFAANTDKYNGGGMVALIPSDADLDRLTLEGEEPRDDLHLTLWYLGDEPLNAEQREDVLREVAHAVEDWYPIEGNAFGVAHWNPQGEHPAWVLNVGDARDETTDDGPSNLALIRSEVGSGIAQEFVLPKQHTPWQPHICIAYSSDDLLDELTQRLGPVTFDKIRVAYGRDVFDIELDGDDVITAAGGKGGKKNIKDYWTKDPRGLAKWVDDPHPWTALYNHLKKHMPNEMAKRVASEWYHEVKGHWPSEKRGK